MKIVFVVASLMWFGLALAETPPASAIHPYEGSYVRRPTIVVSDLDVSLALYRDILGFRLGSVKEDAKDSYVYETFNIPVEATTRHATLDSDREKRTLSLVEYREFKPIDAKTMVRHSAILVNANGRFSEIKAALEAGGYHQLSIHSLGQNGVEMGFLDSDGHLIVIYEFRP